MAADEDDLTPEQRGLAPPTETLRRRGERATTGRGRSWRPRSWLTVFVALIAVALSVFLFLRS